MEKCFGLPVFAPDRHKNSVYTAVSILFALFLICGPSCNAKHVTGRYKSREFYSFLTKFGFQETDPKDRTATSGYVFGNITLETGDFITSDLKFVALGQKYWANYSEPLDNGEYTDRSQVCADMFDDVEQVAYDRRCLPNGTVDLMRTIPCPLNRLCWDDDLDARNVIPGYQFTIRVEDLTSPRFWYLSMVSCYHNWTAVDPDHCTWHHNKRQNIYINYDIWLVNGDPLAEYRNLFYYQFSFTLQGVLGIYLAFIVFYLPLIACHTMAHTKHMHPIVKLFTVCLYIQFGSILLIFIHLILYSQDGEGIEVILQFGNVMDMITQCLFMLLLLLIAKGWTITTTVIGQKRIMLIIWGTYCMLYAVLFIWQMFAMDPSSDLNEYQTWPGALILTLRCMILVWFWLELKTTRSQEFVDAKLQFYRWFGIGYSIWFIYLPLTVIVISQVSPLWRQKTVSAMMITADFVSYLVMAFLFWPTRSSAYFKLGTSGDENRALLEKYSHLFESI